MSAPASGERATEPRDIHTRFPHVYVHWPFCAHKCPYCDFNSHAGRDDESHAYAEALLREARAWGPVAAPETVFVGGGTPTHADTELLGPVLGDLLDVLGRERLEEVTVEANPGSLDRAKVRAMCAAGVDRVSLGVQSFHDKHLKTLGRIHDARDAVRGVEILREGGMRRFSLDLILAVPGQTLPEQIVDVNRAIDLEPEHISAYVLTFEPGTVFTRMLAEGRLPAPDDERELTHLHAVAERLREAGYERYEISNFARGDAQSRHNLAYWRMRDWIGIGAGAHSHFRGRRWKNLDDPRAYAEGVLAHPRGIAPRAFEEHVDRESHAFEHLIMGLRLAEGVDLADIEARTGVDLLATHGAVWREHEAAGRLVVEGRRVRLTAKGFDLTDAILRSLAV